MNTSRRCIHSRGEITSLPNPFAIKTIITYFLCASHLLGTAQTPSIPGGARSLGMANASACLGDIWSMANNAAGLSEVKGTEIAAAFHAIPAFKPFNRMGTVIASPLADGVAGASVFRFGDDLYSEHVVSCGYANKLGLASLGVKLNWLQFRADNLPTRNAVTVSFGGIARITSGILIGAHIMNVNQPEINEISGERVTSCLVAGVALQPSSKVTASAELEKLIDQPPVVKTGIEYEPFARCAFRTGFNLYPTSVFAGFGVNARRLQADYAVHSSPVFGFCHQASVCYRVKNY